ncbi:MAG: hypothetical protein AABY46_08560 [Nitrospirota bacterium]
MKYATLLMFVASISLMTGCACMTCPIGKKAQEVSATEYIYDVDCLYLNNITTANARLCPTIPV